MPPFLFLWRVGLSLPLEACFRLSGSFFSTFRGVFLPSGVLLPSRCQSPFRLFITFWTFPPRAFTASGRHPHFSGVSTHTRERFARFLWYALTPRRDSHVFGSGTALFGRCRPEFALYQPKFLFYGTFVWAGGKIPTLPEFRSIACEITCCRSFLREGACRSSRTCRPSRRARR